MFKTRRFLKKLLKEDEDGAVAIEFALVAIPFFALLFGIIELAITFFMTSALQGATFDAARNIKTNDVTYANGAEFARNVCEGLNPNSSESKIATCVGRTEVRVLPMSDFQDQDIFSSEEEESSESETTGTEEEEIEQNLIQTNGGETVYIEVIYNYPLVLPGKLTRLSNGDDDYIREIRVVTVHRNEPFGDVTGSTTGEG